MWSSHCTEQPVQHGSSQHICHSSNGYPAMQQHNSSSDCIQQPAHKRMPSSNAHQAHAQQPAHKAHAQQQAQRHIHYSKPTRHIHCSKPTRHIHCSKPTRHIHSNKTSFTSVKSSLVYTCFLATGSPTMTGIQAEGQTVQVNSSWNFADSWN